MQCRSKGQSNEADWLADIQMSTGNASEMDMDLEDVRSQ